MCEAKSGFCLGMSLVTLGSILLCILCAENIPSYIHTNFFKETSCIVQQTSFIGNVCCDIHQRDSLDDCNTVYPCFSTTVQFPDKDGYQRSGILFDKHKTYAYQKCSYFACGYKPYGSFLEDAEKYAADEGSTGRVYGCAYDPDNPSFAVKGVTRVSYVVHAVLWPTIILIIGCVITCVSCIVDAETNCGNGCCRRCGSGKKDDVPADEVVDPETAVVVLEDGSDDVKYDYENESFENESCAPGMSSATKN